MVGGRGEGRGGSLPSGQKLWGSRNSPPGLPQRLEAACSQLPVLCRLEGLPAKTLFLKVKTAGTCQFAEPCKTPDIVFLFKEPSEMAHSLKTRGERSPDLWGRLSRAESRTLLPLARTLWKMLGQLPVQHNCPGLCAPLQRVWWALGPLAAPP